MRRVVVRRQDDGVRPGRDGTWTGADVRHGPADRHLRRVANGQARRSNVTCGQIGVRGQGRILRYGGVVVVKSGTAAARTGRVVLEYLVVIVGRYRELDVPGARRAQRQRIGELARTRVIRRDGAVAASGGVIKNIGRGQRGPRGGIQNEHIIVEQTGGRARAGVAVLPGDHEIRAGLQAGGRSHCQIGDLEVRIRSERRGCR